MSGNLQLYAMLFFGAEGTLLAEEHQITQVRHSNATRVNTTAKGFAGMSPGSPIIEIDVGNAVPQAGFEFDMGQKIAGLIPVAFQVLGPGGKSVRGQGFVYEDTLTHGVSKEAEYSFRLVAPLALFS